MRWGAPTKGHCPTRKTSMPITVSCEMCGMTMVRPPSAVRRSQHLYCSPTCQGAAKSQRALETFWTKVQRCDHGENCADCCWEWQGARFTTGYGLIWQGNKARGAHRIAYILTCGPIPQGVFILHTCDHPPCVNPAHLRLGTPADNHLDAQTKGRLALGDRHWTRRHPERVPRGDTHYRRQRS